MSDFHWERKGRQVAAPKTYAQELGWTARRDGKSAVYSGHYRARGIRYEGWIVTKSGGKLLFYILNPPLALLRETEFGGCFHFNNDDWWLIGFHPGDQPTDVCSGIAAIQKALMEAFNVRTAKRRTEL